LDAAYDLIKGWTAEERGALRPAAAKDGMTGQVGAIKVQDIAQQVIELSRRGLRRRQALDAAGTDETGFLKPLTEIARSGENFAQLFLKDIEEGADAHALFDRYAFQ
ncbi:MAG: glutamate--cysteine ligase, partial [Pseudomonadota bacterium]